MKVTMSVMNFKMGLIVYVNMKSQIQAKSQNFDFENDHLVFLISVRTESDRWFCLIYPTLLCLSISFIYDMKDCELTKLLIPISLPYCVLKLSKIEENLDLIPYRD